MITMAYERRLAAIPRVLALEEGSCDSVSQIRLVHFRLGFVIEFFQHWRGHGKAL